MQTTMLTGVLIGAAVAVSLIGIVVLFLYRRYKLSRPDVVLHSSSHLLLSIKATAAHTQKNQSSKHSSQNPEDP
ncbi:hypothetical protein PAMP_013433 [Pampus punctatissimus]